LNRGQAERSRGLPNGLHSLCRKMETAILKIDADNPEPRQLEQAAEVIWRGGIAAVPTDTVYGLAADPANAAAVKRIYEVKGRDFRRPLILLAANLEMVERLDLQILDLARKAMEHFWPGGLTLVLQAAPSVPQHLLAGGTTIGLRIPAHPVALGLIEMAGFPLASTSANRSGSPSALRSEEVIEALGEEIDLVIDSGPASLGVESSVVDFTQSPPRLLREGCLTRQALEQVLGGIE